MHKCRQSTWIYSLVIALLSLTVAARSLPSFQVDIKQSSVSGFSSGAFMAVQMHIAHAAIMQGVGVIAGGPYYCAQGSMQRALYTCMRASPDIAPLLDVVKLWAAQGLIDDPQHLARQRVWLFSSPQDPLLHSSVMDALYDFYRAFINSQQIVYQRSLATGHAHITLNYGSRCDFNGGDYINRCHYDAAGEILQAIYGPLQARNQGSLSGKFIAFDQQAFADFPTASIGLADTGYLYVPASCLAGEKPCRVHIVFHGCKQSATRIGDRFYRHAGYNRWADSNHLIILYPQTLATWTFPFNPHGCWDWWGYTNANYPHKHGLQIAAVRAMLARLSAARD